MLVKSLRRARVRADDRVLVIGLGVMGLLHLLAVRALARPGLLLAADRVPERLAAGGRIADATIDTSAETLDDGVARTDRERGCGRRDRVSRERRGPRRRPVGWSRRAARSRWFAPTAPGVFWPVPVHDLFFRETTLVPSYSAGPTDTREAMRLLAEGLPVEPLITHRLPLREAARGYALVRAGGAALKVIVHP